MPAIIKFGGWEKEPRVQNSGLYSSSNSYCIDTIK